MTSRYREDEDGVEGYFASISDLMVGILFIFLLMLTVFALNFADENKDEIIRDLEAKVASITRQRDAALLELADTRARLAQKEAANKDLTKQNEKLTTQLEDLKARERQRQEQLALLIETVKQVEAEVSSESRLMQKLRSELLVELKARLKQRQIEVEISEQQDVLRLPSKEIFQLGTATFTPVGREQMGVLLDELGRLLPCYAISTTATCDPPKPIFETVLIEGHTDTLPGDNWPLSTGRALAVRSLMIGPLVPLTELRNLSGQPLLGLAGYGDSRPLPQIAGNDPRNRRIEIRFLLSASREAELASLRESLRQLRERLTRLQTP